MLGAEVQLQPFTSRYLREEPTRCLELDLLKCSAVLYHLARMLHPDVGCHIGLMFHCSIKLLFLSLLSQFSQDREAVSHSGLLQTLPKQYLYMLAHSKDNYDIVSL